MSRRPSHWCPGDKSSPLNVARRQGFSSPTLLALNVVNFPTGKRTATSGKSARRLRLPGTTIAVAGRSCNLSLQVGHRLGGVLSGIPIARMVAGSYSKMSPQLLHVDAMRAIVVFLLIETVENKRNRPCDSVIPFGY